MTVRPWLSRPAAALLLVTLMMLAACVSSTLFEEPEPMTTQLSCGEALSLGVPSSPDNALVGLLDTGREAFAARIALIEAARCSIDAQYYIWNSDATGRYLAARLYAAAERGIRVRVLLDDINTAGRDSILAALAHHPNIDVRIYNPFQSRGALRSLGFISEFSRLNRRMHNKSFTVDGVVTVLGGRNIGDEYFDSASTLNFRDRDVLVSGAPAGDTQRMFTDFWNSALSRSIISLAKQTDPLPGPAAVERTRLELSAELTARHGVLPLSVPEGEQLLAEFTSRMLSASAHLVHDLPPRPDAVADTDEPQPSAVALGQLAAAARQSVLIESAYLVMDDETLTGVTALRQRGVQVQALTNSLASNDVTANHAAYAGRRRQMLDAGIELFELRPDAASCAVLIGGGRACQPGQSMGLHAKTFVFDREVVYVGSLNLNLRSRYLNAESGLIINNRALAQRIADDIELNMHQENSWSLGLDTGNVVWFEDRLNPAAARWTHEPTVPWSRRFMSGLIARLGLEKYL